MAEALEWLKRAKSSLVYGKIITDEDLEIFGEDLFFEDPCFQLQQCAEKSIKAILIFNNIKFPKTHVIAELLDLMRNNSLEVPDNIIEASELTQYAVRTRYPDEFRRITKAEYLRTAEIAEKIYNWASNYLKSV